MSIFCPEKCKSKTSIKVLDCYRKNGLILQRSYCKQRIAVEKDHVTNVSQTLRATAATDRRKCTGIPADAVGVKTILVHCTTEAVFDGVAHKEVV